MMKMSSSQILTDGFVFSGNWQQTVSKALFLDRRLTPLERNAWQVIRMMLEPDGITALPTYEQLRPYLTSMPYAQQASFETVARALTILRLTRWLSLSRRRRASNGTKQSNLYILHDEPLTPFEAIRLDDDYFALVCQSITHTSKAIQHVASGVLDDINHDPFLLEQKLPTRLEVLLGRVSEQKLSTEQKSEVSEDLLIRNQNTPTSQSEAGLKPANDHLLRNPNKPVSSSNRINILRNSETPYKIPKRFNQLKPAQQKGIFKAIQNLSPEIQQQIFTEWDHRCQTQTIRNPAAYLFGIAQKAFKGELNILVALEKTSLIPPLMTMPAIENPTGETYLPPTPEEKAQILRNLQQLKASFQSKI